MRATPGTAERTGPIWYWARSCRSVSGRLAEVMLYAMTGKTVGSIRRTWNVVPAGNAGSSRAASAWACR